MPYDPIEQEIVDALPPFNKLAVQKNYKNADWTNGVKAIFNALAHKNRYQSYSGFDSRGRYSSDQIRQDAQQVLGGLHVPTYLYGWLYDILWWRHNDQGYAIDIPLVAESEWGNENDVHDDFQRLLLARSKYKVMIFGCGNGFIQWGKDQIQKFKYTQKGDRYLFCSWTNNRDGFHFELYVHP